MQKEDKMEIEEKQEPDVREMHIGNEMEKWKNQ